MGMHLLGGGRPSPFQGQRRTFPGVVFGRRLRHPRTAPFFLPQTLMGSSIVLGCMALLILLPSACTGAPEGRRIITLNGAGATFPLPIYTEWIHLYSQQNPSVIINYQGIGSGGGQKAILDGTVDFAGSDSPLNEEHYRRMPDLQMLPMVAGAIVLAYNLEGVDSLVLDGPTAARIFMAEITRWNDAAIARLNPDAHLPDAPITVVHRSDGSGTTEIFTSYLAAVYPEWEEKVGVGKAVEWPVDKAGSGIGGKGNPGVAHAIQITPNSIGYLELSQALENDIPFADLINAAGKRVRANAETMQAAMAAMAGAFDERFTARIVNAPGENSWPIMGYTYLILHMEPEDCAKAKALADFIRWAITDEAAARKAAEMGYATLPPEVGERVLEKLAEIRCR
ncbi:MAG TPA: phosphate ABC transporter substrate-binding protein PstS [Chloroflexi bacterium]|nr:phosphate ABC transporter substrate-binding protein PstS [Chloroflexota bacterium]